MNRRNNVRHRIPAHQPTVNPSKKLVSIQLLFRFSANILFRVQVSNKIIHRVVKSILGIVCAYSCLTVAMTNPQSPLSITPVGKPYPVVSCAYAFTAHRAPAATPLPAPLGFRPSSWRPRIFSTPNGFAPLRSRRVDMILFATLSKTLVGRCYRIRWMSP